MLVLEEDFDSEALDAFGLDATCDDRGNGFIVALDVETLYGMDAVWERATEAGDVV